MQYHANYCSLKEDGGFSTGWIPHSDLRFRVYGGFSFHLLGFRRSCMALQVESSFLEGDFEEERGR